MRMLPHVTPWETIKFSRYPRDLGQDCQEFFRREPNRGVVEDDFAFSRSSVAAGNSLKDPKVGKATRLSFGVRTKLGFEEAAERFRALLFPNRS
jgi:hypothetical protein